MCGWSGSAGGSLPWVGNLPPGLAALTEPVEPLPEAGEVRRLHLGPGDHLVITYPMRISQASADRLRDKLRAWFGPDVPIHILDSGAELTVVAEEVAGSADDLPGP